jgi:hypothetical protein
MRPVSAAFLDAVSSSHKMVARARLVTNNPFGLNPAGTVIPILDGDVKLSATADIKSTLELVTSGDYWDQLQPYGTEVFVERGIDYGSGSVEWVGLGYFRIETIEQPNAPTGTIRIIANDRTAQMQQNRVLFPYQFPAGRTHTQAFSRLVNGDDGGGQSTAGYGMFVYIPVPITFYGYVGTSVFVPAGGKLVASDSTYDFLAQLAATQSSVLRFNASGGLDIISINVNSSAPVYTLATGHNGTLTQCSRSVSRTGVYNIVSAYGTDPTLPTNYALAYNDGISPIRWSGGSAPWFGAAPRYYASPFLTTDTQCDTAAESILSRYTGLPKSITTYSVPNPALEPLDVVTIRLGPGTEETHVINDMTIPLTAAGALQISTRTLTVAEDALP